MKIGIIGIGLIGGSIAKELKTKSLGTVQVYGVESNPLHAKKVKELNLVDELLSAEQLFEKADVIF